MKIFDLNQRCAEAINVETLLELTPLRGGQASFGVAEFAAGSRHPARGMSSHERHEITYIIEGEMQLTTENRCITARPGQVVWLDPEEAHATTSIDDGKVFWVLYG